MKTTETVTLKLPAGDGSVALANLRAFTKTLEERIDRVNEIAGGYLVTRVTFRPGQYETSVIAHLEAEHL